MKKEISSELVHLSSVPQTSKWAIKPRVPFLLVFWLSVAALLTLIGHLTVLGRPFDNPGAWVSAHFSTMARSFVEHGIVALGGVPIQNNSPLGLEPDAYIHWPPLFPILLSVVFRIFGESESVARGLMLVILLANEIALYTLVRACCGKQAGLFAVFALLVMPVTIIYGRTVLHLPLAILCMLLALFGVAKATVATYLHWGWAVFGAASMALAVLASWEPLLACPGLLAVAMWQRRQALIRLALLYSSVGVAVLIGVITIYLYNSPNLSINLWHAILFRAGFVLHSPEPLLIHTLDTLLDKASQQPSLLNLLTGFANRLELIGPFATVAVGGVLVTGWIRRRSDSDRHVALLFGGLIAPWLLWFIIMANHAYIHEYEMLLAVPGAAAALGWGMATLINLAGKETTLDTIRWVVLIVLPPVMLLPLTRDVKDRLVDLRREPPIFAYTGEGRAVKEGIDYARAVKESTEPGAVVMMPDISMVPVYYSKRHMIRGVANDSIVDKVTERIAEVFPGSPVYLALHPATLQEFSQSLQRYRVIKESTHLVLLAVPVANISSGH